MSLPAVTTILNSSAPPPNPQDLSAIAMVVGPCSSGPYTPTQLNSEADALQFGDGPGIEQALDILNTAGGPVYFTRSVTTTASVLTGPSKEAIGSGAPTQVYGAILLPGTDHNGDVLFQSLQPGVTLTVAVGGAAALTASGKAVTLTVTNATTGTQVAALSLAAVSTLIAAPVAEGTGASVCGQTLTATAFDAGSVSYTPKGATAYVVAGVDANGGVAYLSSQSGVQVQQVTGGTLGATQIGNLLYVQLGGSTALQVAALINGSGATPPAPAAVALGITALATGTGASLASAIGATTLVAIEVAHVIAGASTLLSTAVATGGATVTVTDSTNSNSEPTGTAAAVVGPGTGSVLSNPTAAFLVTAAAVGSGSGIVGPQAAAALSWGSSGAMTLSGTPNDCYYLQIQIVRPGTPGSTPAPTFRWAVDCLAGTALTPNWSSETLIPAGGVVALSNSRLTTGLTATFSGTLGAGDAWLGYSTTPESGLTDLETAINAARADTTKAWGFLTSPSPITSASATALDSLAQGDRSAGVRYWQGLWNVRDVGDGVPGETLLAWEAAQIGNYQGYVSPRGLTSVCARAVLHESTYTLAQFRRPAVFAAATRKASIPIHEDLGYVGRGPLANVLYIFSDEYIQGDTLHGQRFITPRTYPQLPGQYYLTDAPTMADATAPEDAGYTLYERVSIALAIARISGVILLQFLKASLAGLAVGDPAAGIVAGALAPGPKGQIEGQCNQAVETFIYSAKSDGQASASPLPVGQKMVQVLQQNDFLSDRTINVATQYIPLGSVDAIKDTITVKIP